MSGGVCLLAGLGPFERVQDLIALVDTWPQFLLARKTNGVVEMTDDAPVAQVQLGRELELERHGWITGAQATGSGSSKAAPERVTAGTAEPFHSPALEEWGVEAAIWQVFPDYQLRPRTAR